MIDNSIAAQNSFPKQNFLLRVRNNQVPRILNLVAIVAIYLYAVFWSATRAQGDYLLIVLFAIISISAALDFRVAYIRAVAPLSLLTLLYLPPSLAHVLPHAWTALWEPYAAARQAFYSVLMPPTIVVFVSFFRRYDIFNFRLSRLLILALVPLCANLLISVASGRGPVFHINNLINSAAISLFLFSIIIIRTRFFIIKMGMLILLVVTATTVQTAILAAALLGTVSLRRPQWITAGLIAFIIALYIVAPIYSHEIYRDLDANTGVRGIMWTDALRAARDTYLVGVGFGTEAFTRTLSFFNVGAFDLFGDNSTDAIFKGSHSVFFEALLRMGIAGGACVIYLAWQIYPLQSRSLTKSRLDHAIFNEFLIITSVNVGISSVNFVFGTCLCIGWLVYSSTFGRANEHTDHAATASEQMSHDDPHDAENRAEG